MKSEEFKEMENLKHQIIDLKNKLYIEKMKSKRDWSAFRLSAMTSVELLWLFRYCDGPNKQILIFLIIGGLVEVLDLKLFYDSQKELNVLRKQNEDSKVYKKSF